MISVNGASIDFTLFPDNTTSFRYNPCCFEYNILWRYDDDRECILLWYLVNHIRENSEVTPEIVLTMPYIPNARMDRVRATDEVFTLKWFSDFINLMYFDNLGFTYDQLDQYIMSGTSGDKSIDEKISSLHVRNLHKLKLMPAYGGQP